MKKIYLILLAAASFFFAPTVEAQTIAEYFEDEFGSAPHFSKEKEQYTIDSYTKAAYRKSVSDPYDDGTYWIKLETFGTGSAKKEVSSTPSDIILVLDLSSSMDNERLLYNFRGQRVHRIVALRTVIEEFAQTVYENDYECRLTDTNYKGDRIAIIGYNRNANFITTGGWVYIKDVVSKDGDTYSGTLINQIRGMSCAQGTRPDHGLDMALAELLDGQQRDDAKLTALMFTDGYPTDNNASNLGEPNNNGDSNKFEFPFANKTLYYGSKIKALGASLYTVGLITTVNQADSWQYHNYCRVVQMMDWLSSNYPNAKWANGVVTETTQGLAIEGASSTGSYYNGYNATVTQLPNNGYPVYREPNIGEPWDNEWEYDDGDITLDDFEPGTTTSDGDKFTSDGYCYIVDDNTDFSDIFNAIAKQTSGTANKDLGTASSNVDIISNSFVLPDDIDASSVKIFTANLTSITKAGGTITHPFEPDGSVVYNFAPEILAPNNPYKYTIYDADGNAIGIQDIDANISVTLDEETQAITVTNFDYASNFCGPVYKGDGETFDHWQGVKIIIMIPIQANPDAVGGPNVETNADGSGLFDKDNHPIIKFDSPTISLPVNVYIEKKGITGRESAKFTIFRAELPDMSEWTEEQIAQWDPNTYYDEDDWDYVSTVFVTNSPDTEKSSAGYPMVRVKSMPSTMLDKNNQQIPLIYKISEEPWSWSYTPKTEPQFTVTTKIDNPFTFDNEKKDNIDIEVRHAESKVMNYFWEGTTKRYDDSKTNTGPGRESSGSGGTTSTTNP